MNAERRGQSLDSVKLYLDEIGEHSLLSAQEERDLSYRIIEGREAWRRLEEDRPTQLTEVSQYEQIFLDGLSARTTFINSNLRLVVSIAKRYTSVPGAFILDLIQEGSFGLEHAVEKFDPSKGFKFSTYATYWIRQAVTRSLSRVPVIHLPISLNDEIRTADHNNRPLTREQKIGKSIASVLYYDAEVAPDGDASLIDFVADPDSFRDYEEVERVLEAAPVIEVLETLPERQCCAVKLRFGIGDSKPRTVDQVGTAMGISSEAARKNINKGLEKLKLHFEVSV